MSATGGIRSDKTINGSGNLTVRMRFNVFGDDGGTPLVFAIIPQVNVPTATRAHSNPNTSRAA